MSLIVHPDTATQLACLTNHLPQSLLLQGLPGAGLQTIARWLAADHLGGFLQPVNKTTGQVDPSGVISVARIRDLQQSTQGKHATRHVIIIDDADRMTTATQNAFLKLLEEPPTNTHFILTSHHSDNLLPTVLSRVQRVAIKRATTEQTSQLIQQLDPHIDPTKLRQLLFIASGLPAEIHRLLADETYFKAKAAYIGDARTLLGGTPYQKLVLANTYQGDRSKALELLSFTQLVAYQIAASRPTPQLISQLQAFVTAQTQLMANYSVRLVLLRLVV